MKRLFRFVAIVLPGLLGIILSSVAAKKIFERYSVKPADVLAAQNGSFLPRAPLVNLNNNHDEYQNVIRGKVLLLFVTTDCDACGKELSNVSDIAPRLLSKVRVYGVGIEDPDSVKTFAEKNHVGFSDVIGSWRDDPSSAGIPQYRRHKLSPWTIISGDVLAAQNGSFLPRAPLAMSDTLESSLPQASQSCGYKKQQNFSSDYVLIFIVIIVEIDSAGFTL
jgi:hypothetical protein